jgi:hypothetical protein
MQFLIVLFFQLTINKKRIHEHKQRARKCVLLFVCNLNFIVVSRCVTNGGG